MEAIHVAALLLRERFSLVRTAPVLLAAAVPSLRLG